MQDEYEMYKIAIIGSSGTGKTNISTKYVRDTFNQTSQATLGVEFLTKIVQYCGKTVKISLWDTAGQQRYRALSKVYYKGASGIIVVYDITDAKSYLDIELWMRLINQNLNVEDVIIMVVGNKVDLQSERQVPFDRPEHEFKDTFDIDCWEVSAKTGKNINELFGDMIKKIIEKASDIKSTMYRGTVEYESERGTLVKQQSKGEKVERGQNVGVLGARVGNPSIILQEEQDLKSNAADYRNEQTNYKNAAKNAEVFNRLTLSVNMHKQIQAEKDKKRRKCC